MLESKIMELLLTLPGIIIGLSFHEFAHALAADKLGDPTPRNQGRLTLSPLPHIDPIGLLMLVLLRFGWAKPVMIDHRYFKNPKRDDLIVSVAGPLMNLLTAFVFTLILKVLVSMNIITYNDMGFYLFIYTILININLFLFNLLPIPPLDGFHILSDLLPLKHSGIIYKLEQYSFIILIIILVTPVVTYVLTIPSNFIFTSLMKIAGF